MLLKSFAKTVFFLFLALNLFTVSSQDKYPSLLWKIEGNELQKPSYLYGTMHVSSKIAFNLGDEFFDALSSVDAVALETNPELWLDFYRGDALNEASNIVYNRGESYSGQRFYQNFLRTPTYSLDRFQRFLSPQDRMLNQLLYRYNYGEENYEETTYLDMFLYQSAKKSGKPVFSLEDFLESFFLARRSSLPDEDESDYESSGISQEKLETAYLERDLDLLDSMISENFSKNYRKYLLNIRNENMVVALDSLMPKMSVFAGVGAAHLPGEKGMIELLREKGYTVSKVEFNKSSSASKKFKKIKQSAVNLPTTPYTSEDGRIKTESIGKFYPENQSENAELHKSYFLPDYANGAYYGYERMVKMPYAENYSSKGGLNYIDSVLYLITPGEIMTQKRTNIGEFEALEVTSELSRNNFIRILIVDTPQELIVFKAGGNKSFIKSKNVKSFFKNIKIEKGSSQIDTQKTGVKVSLPQNYLVFHKNKGNMLIIGENESQEYFSFHSEYLKDFNNLEEDEFELEYLVNEFAEKIDYEVEKMNLDEKSVFAVLKKEEQNLFVHYTIHHNFYYQLITNSNKKEAENYFNSLNFTSPDYSDEKLNKENDTLLNYSFKSYFNSSIDTTILKELKSLKEDFIEAENREDSLNRSFEGSYNTRLYEDPVTGTSVLIRHSTLNKYYSVEEGIEDIQNRIKLKFSEDSLFYNAEILEDRISDTSYRIKYIYTKEGTDRVLYNLETIIDNEFVTITSSYDTTLNKPTFIEQIYESFVSTATSSEDDYLLEDKGEMWLEDLKSEKYQLKQQAKESVGEVVFGEESREKLEAVLMNDSLEILDQELRLDLLSKHYYFFNEDSAYLDFLTTFYEKYKTEPALQVAALEKMSELGTAKSTQRFMTAIEERPPMTNDKYEIYRMFAVFSDSTELLKPILPRLQEFALEYEEYLPRVIYLIDRANIQRTFSTDDLSDEFLEKLKKRARQNLRKMNYAKDDVDKYNDLLKEMLELGSVLHCYSEKDKMFGEIIEKLDTISDKHFEANYLAKRINRGQSYDISEVEEIIRDTNYIYPFFEWISGHINHDSLLAIVEPSKELIYHSYLIENADYSLNTDSIKFHSVDTSSTFGLSGEVYYYTSESTYGSKQILAVYFVDPEKKVDLETLYIDSIRYEKGEMDEALKKLKDKVRYSNRVRVSTSSSYL